VKSLYPSMKALPIVLACLAAHAFAQDAPESIPDPTRSSARMKAALMAGGSYAKLVA